MLPSVLKANGPNLLRTWEALRRIPGGRLVFSRLVGRMAPYTGTIDARVRELAPGYALVEMSDRRAVRNHLNCIHAIALLNLAEVSTGLAVVCGLPEGARGILKGLSIEYVKKGRGLLTGECRCAPVTASEKRVYDVQGVIRDTGGDVVARATAQWLVGPGR